MSQTLITTGYHGCSERPLSYIAVEEDDDGNVWLDWSQLEGVPLTAATLSPSEARALAAALAHYAELSPRSD